MYLSGGKVLFEILFGSINYIGTSKGRRTELEWRKLKYNSDDKSGYGDKILFPIPHFLLSYTWAKWIWTRRVMDFEKGDDRLLQIDFSSSYLWAVSFLTSFGPM